MNTLITTSVVRGSHKGESHGGVFLLNLEKQTVQQVIDWNTVDINWEGRGADRGLRGIAFDNDTVYVAASDELFAYTPDFKLLGIDVFERSLFLTSTGYDSILAFSLDRKVFHWALHIEVENYKFRSTIFDPRGDDGPLMLNKMHLNNVCCTKGGMYLSGLNTGGMLHFNGKTTLMSVELPAGTHNARPFRDGVLFNDSEADVLRYSGRGEGQEDRSLSIPKYAPEDLTHKNLDDQRIARQGFARGLCVLSERIVAGGSSPSTITLYDLKDSRQLMSVNLTRDIRNAIHGLEIWPYS